MRKPDYGFTPDMTPAERTAAKIAFWAGAVFVKVIIVLVLALPMWALSRI